MITFQDGPAKGQTLMLKRTPRFLRVTETAGKFDALDQLEDKPLPNETIHAYEFTEHKGGVHINRGGGRGGFYQMVSYKVCPIQPSQEEMRDGLKWQAWCIDQAKHNPRS